VKTGNYSSQSEEATHFLAHDKSKNVLEQAERKRIALLQAPAVRARRKAEGAERCVWHCDRLRGIRSNHGGDDGDNGSMRMTPGRENFCIRIVTAFILFGFSFVLVFLSWS
jgi:hypothetical protein